MAVASWAADIPLTAYNLGVRREPSVAVVARWAVEARPRIAPGADCRVVFSFGANDATIEVGRFLLVLQPQAHNTVRYTLRVPSNVTVDVETVNGRIAAQNIRRQCERPR